jgi:hypothetical protein
LVANYGSVIVEPTGEQGTTAAMARMMIDDVFEQCDFGKHTALSDLVVLSCHITPLADLQLGIPITLKTAEGCQYL